MQNITGLKQVWLAVVFAMIAHPLILLAVDYLIVLPPLDEVFVMFLSGGGAVLLGMSVVLSFALLRPRGDVGGPPVVLDPRTFLQRSILVMGLAELGVTLAFVAGFGHPTSFFLPYAAGGVLLPILFVWPASYGVFSDRR